MYAYNYSVESQWSKRPVVSVGHLLVVPATAFCLITGLQDSKLIFIGPII